ncbi:MAG: CocE/NonD family hydrolase C-terminal non-catalytic domain-containing protein [Egibacteraceae bacterium]
MPVDLAPDRTAKTVERGFLHLDDHQGLATSQPAPGEWIKASATPLPQGYTFGEGHRIGLLIQGSNTVWAVPGNPGPVNVANGKVPEVTAVGSKLVLPTVGVNASQLFTGS